MGTCGFGKGQVGRATDLEGIYMRQGRTQTGMNSDLSEIFATVFMKLGRNAWCLISGQTDVFLSNKYIADPKSYRLEISGPCLRFVVIYMRTVRTQTGTRISRLGPVTETKSDWSHVNT